MNQDHEQRYHNALRKLKRIGITIKKEYKEDFRKAYIRKYKEEKK